MEGREVSQKIWDGLLGAYKGLKHFGIVVGGEPVGCLLGAYKGLKLMRA